MNKSISNNRRQERGHKAESQMTGAAVKLFRPRCSLWSDDPKSSNKSQEYRGTAGGMGFAAVFPGVQLGTTNGGWTNEVVGKFYRLPCRWECAFDGPSGLCF